MDINLTKKSDTIFFNLILIFVFLCPFIYIRGLNNYVTLPQSAFIQIFTILILILFSFKYIFLKKSISINTHPLNGAVLFFLAWTLAASFYAHNHYEAFDQWFQWAACILLFFLLQHIIKSQPRALQLLGVIYAAGLVTAIIGITQYLFKITIIPQSAPPAATFANKNMAAQFISLTFPLGIAVLCGSKQKTTTWFAAMGASIMIIFILYTQTRAAWVAVLFEVGLIISIIFWRSFWVKTRLFWDRDKTIATLAGLFLILLFINITPTGFKWQLPSISNRVVSILDYLRTPSSDEPLASQSQENEPHESGSVRIAIWQNTVEMIKDKPITGYGLGNHKIYYPLFHTLAARDAVFSETHQLANVHNDFLQLFAETGVIGGIAAVCVFLSFFAIIAKLLGTHIDSVFFSAMGIGVSVTGILINSCFSFPFEMPVPPLILMIYFSIVLCLVKNRRTYVVKAPEKWIGLLILILIPLFVYSVRYYYVDIQYDRYYLQAKSLERKGKWEGVTILANRAFALNPNKKKVLTYAARGYIQAGDYQKGIDALQRVIEAYPFHMNSLLNMGVAHGGLKQYDTAITYYQEVLKIKPAHPKAHINLAGIYMTQKKFSNAIDSFQKAAVSEPNNPKILYNMGMSQIQSKQYQQAAQSLKRTVEIEPGWTNAQLNLAILYYQYLGRQKESVPHFKKTLALNPNVQNKQEIKRIIQKFSPQKK
jgi:tetratricopeptide (TPR) repeat protein/O-antigen ligase